jgi:phosphinothricin acetyltransferase
MSPPFVRDAAEADLAAIAAILNREIAETTATWAATPRSERDMVLWLASRRAPGRAALVAERDGAVAGYGALGPFRPGEGYAPTAELSVYVAEAARGAGLGRALVAALIDRARAEGLTRLVAGIGADNEVSVALHRRFGFEEAGRLPGVGRKFGRSLDLVLMLLRLDA